MQKRSSKLESTWKTKQDRSYWKIWLWSKSMVNGQSQRSTIWSKSTINGWRVLTWQCDVTLGFTWQYVKRSRRVGRMGAHGERGNWRVWARKRYWRRVAARAREAETSVGACDVVSGRSWLGFTRDWLFCHSMPLLWQLDEQNDNIRELQGLWAWWRWLASDSDYWMKARVAEERRRCPQEPENQRNDSDTMLTI